MVWLTLGLIALCLVVLGRISLRRHEHDPLVMPYRTGHIGALGEAPSRWWVGIGARRA